MTFARSAGRISSSAASRWVAPWRSSGAAKPVDLVPVRDVGLALAPEALGPLLQRHLVDQPVAGLGELHRDVVHAAGDAAVADRHLPVEHLPEDQGLGGALLEAPHVHHAGGDHLAGVDVRDPRHRHEHRPAAEDLDDQTEHPGRQTARAQRRPRGRAACPPGRPPGRTPAGPPGALRRRGSVTCSRATSVTAGRMVPVRLSYDIVDVFTDRPFAGNQLAVVHGADELTTEQCQAIAQEFGYSETTFPASGRAGGPRVRRPHLHPGAGDPVRGPPDARHRLGAAVARPAHLRGVRAGLRCRPDRGRLRRRVSSDLSADADGPGRPARRRRWRATCCGSSA